MNQAVVIGAGNAGICLYAYLKLIGIEVKLYADPNHKAKLNYILQNGEKVKLIDHVLNKEAWVNLKESDLCFNLSDIASYSDVVYNTLPIQAHASIFEDIYKQFLIQNKKFTFLNLGGGFGIFQQILIQNKNVLANIATFHTLPFASRLNKNEVTLLNVRKSTQCAFSNNKEIEIEISKYSYHLFNANLVLDNSIIHMSIDRSSYHMHPAILMANIGLVESGEVFYFYRQGLTKSVNNLLINCGIERSVLGKKFGYTDFVDPYKRMENFHTWFMKDFENVEGPSTLNHRFMVEDVCYGLVPLYTLGRIMGVEMPLTKGLIEVACGLTNVNFWNSPLNLESHKDLAEIFLKYQ